MLHRHVEQAREEGIGEGPHHVEFQFELMPDVLHRQPSGQSSHSIISKQLGNVP